ncbi:MAG: DUF1365 domain-containing protein [Alphaproteobacteria bacterium]|nr:DUF1365 domain-containing protein [Alphaproteobacteria bacterium]
MSTGQIYRGAVMHRRHRPVAHRFRYRVFAILLDIDRLEASLRGMRLLSWNRFNLFSFHDRDHGPRDGSSLGPWIKARLHEAGIDHDGGAIRLLCFPRILGYVFNPLSLYFCHRLDGSLAAIVYEVKNTFGEQHVYVLPAAHGEGRHRCAKSFYVSPFIGMSASYQFRLRAPDERLAISIRETDEHGSLLDAVMTGRRVDLTDFALVRCFVAYPLMTLKVIAAIHFEAFRLWRKGLPIYPHSGSSVIPRSTSP